MIYICIFLLLIYLIYRYDYKHNERGRLFWLVVVTLIFIVLGGLHYRVGFDSIQYERFYDHLKPLNRISFKDIESSRYAPGFILLASFTKLLDPEPVLLYFLESSFVCGVVLWFFKKNTSHPFFALLMFFCYIFTIFIFEEIREAIAVGFFLLAWPAFKSNNWVRWYALSFCALAFHTSATVMFVVPLILLPGFRQLFIFGKRTIIICLFMCILAFVIKAKFGEVFRVLAVTQALSDLTSKYDNTVYVNNTLNILGILAFFIRQILYPLLALISLNSFKNSYIKNTEFRKLEMLVMASIYVTILNIGVPILGRLNNYFFFFSIIIISDWVFTYICLYSKKVRLRFVYWVILLLPMFTMQIYSYYWAKVNKAGTNKAYMVYYPYTSYLSKDKNPERMEVLRQAKRMVK